MSRHPKRTPNDDVGTVTLRVLGIVALIALTILATVVTT